jgi:hypothetical protein
MRRQPQGSQGAFGHLDEVWDPQDPQLRRVFAEIPAVSGVPGVPLLWRLLANFPSVLSAAWPALANALASAPLRASAQEAIRASFLTQAVGMPSHKAFRGDLVRAEIDADLRAQIERFNDWNQTGVARLLLLAAAMREGARGRVRSVTAATLPRAGHGATEGVYVPPVRRGEERGKAAEVLAQIEREHGLPFLDDYYRSLARVPDYLAAAWNAIRPIVGDPIYLDLAVSLRAVALEWPGAGVAAAMLQAVETAGPGAQRQIRSLLDLCVDAVLPQTLVDITLIKALTSGPDHATSPGGRVGPVD